MFAWSVIDLFLLVLVVFVFYSRTRIAVLLGVEKNKVLDMLKEVDDLKNKNSVNEELIFNLNKQLVFLEGENKSFNVTQKAMQVEFENLASKILESNTTKLKNDSVSSISALLEPLKSKITEFEKRIEDSFNNDIKERYSLSKEIARMASQTDKMIDEANKLSKSLRGDSKIQGIWGEMVLSKILECSGLQKGRDYSVQEKISDGNIPDVVVNLPDDKHLVIDAKTSLKYYDMYLNSNDEEYLNLFLKSMRNHIKNLSSKEYYNDGMICSPGFVFMFVPIESAYALALSNDPDIKDIGLKNRVIIVSPNSLIAMLQAVSSVWKIVDQNKNAAEIARKAGAMYDKFALFAEEMVRLGNSIASSERVYKEAINKLRDGRGSLLKRSEELKAMGIASTKDVKQTRLYVESE